MKNLITTKHLRDNSDETSTYDCPLKRSDITVREFVDAIKRSIHNDESRVFNEWWASCNLSLSDCLPLFPDAKFTLYPDPERETEVKMDGSPSTVAEILAKYGAFIVEQCLWNGGWGGGGYYLKIRKPTQEGLPS